MAGDTSNRISLAGQRILVTRPKEEGESLAKLLRVEGANPLLLPLIEMRPYVSDDFSKQIKKVHEKQYDALLFTSANAARFFWEQCVRTDMPADVLPNSAIYALGQQTQRALEYYGLRAICAEGVYDSEGFLESLQKSFDGELAGKHFFWPRALKVRDVLGKGLEELGAQCSQSVVYETRAAKIAQKLPSGLDWILFASPSAVQAFVDNFAVLPTVKYVCIGKVSARRLKEEGIMPDAIALEPSNEGMVKALLDYCCQ